MDDDFKSAEELRYDEERAQKQQEREARLLARKYQSVFLSTDDGRDVLNDIISQSHLYGTLFTGNSKTYYLLGMREIAMLILNKLNLASFDALEADVQLAREQFLKDVAEGRIDPLDE
jgi:hypothetical protein